MTNHPDDALLHDFVDGRLTDEDRSAVAFHLLDCPRCQAIVAATEELIDSGRESRHETTAPADLWPLVAATTIHERAVRKHVLRSVRRELALAAAVLMLLSGAAGAFGMRIAMRAEDGFSAQRVSRVERLAPRVAVSGLEGLAELEKLKSLEALQNIRVQVDEGGAGGFGGHAESLLPGVGRSADSPLPPPVPAPSANETALAMANDYIAQMINREARAFGELRSLGVSARRIAQVEDSLFQTNRKLSRLRLAYMNAPDNSSLAEELEALFDARIAIIRAAAAEAETGRRP